MGQSLSKDHGVAGHDWTRIDHLEKEVTRLAQALERVSRGLGVRNEWIERPGLRDIAPDKAPRSLRCASDENDADNAMAPEGWPMESSATIRARKIRETIRQRRLREHLFPPDLFADPAWDMMLDLYATHLERGAVSVSSLCIAAAVPATTALRWLKRLTDEGCFIRKEDTRDHRRTYIFLSDAARRQMDQYFDQMLD